MFATLLVVVGALFLAVLGCEILASWPAGDAQKSEVGDAEEGTSIVQAIALSCF